LITEKKLILAVDAMGGDNAPESIVEGCKQFLKENPDAGIRLFGQAEKVQPLLGDCEGIEFIDCPEVIEMAEEPMMAVRRKQNSSLMMGIKDVKAGTSCAFITAGSTGSTFMGAMVTLRMLKGIERPALAPIMPGKKGPFLLIDCGANADCQPQYLMKFGLMGSVYMNRVMGVENPKVGLVNIGAEEEKGSKLYKEAHQLMKAQKAYNFTGNVEAREIQTGETDVIVADGFTGNVILKYAEGFAKVLLGIIKDEIMGSFRGKIGGLLLKPAFKKVKDRMNSDEYGGAPLVGVNGVVIKAHGSSNAYAFKMALYQARKVYEGNVVEKIKEGLAIINNTEEN